MKLIRENTLIEKKSKFISYYYEVDSLDDVDAILNKLALEHKKARHIVYAYKINNDIKKHDAGEPKNSAGFPVLNVMLKNDLNMALIVVIRYFGGTLLGRSRLTRMYIKSASEVIKKHI